ncbi:hypothetical protein GQR60_09685 [Labilibaculum sp. A4]|uniref:DUF4177 domain-containing protein n=1 Tax=Labilibaculum euxinus TaxID=2686357 RepID=A0A425YBN5_9BACT|nr:hypothetical protein [Labilibaculum euxinus]MDQ1771501.1 hypothetical protein [Labilibaculum euxinus]MUP39125.1 hypothetical protein [Labilibaculum euxinus]MVB08330.1 hypothetical protein [Labilibaculum euxinus]MWN76611.1 hypothetical protein [Labilibaculum euxinus]
MKKFLFIAVIAFGFVFESQAQTVQYKVITSVESIVPMGIGRSRLIEEKDAIDAEAFTTERTDGKKSKQGDVKRSDAKVSKFAETKLLNFYSVAGINFQNIASNDALTSSKINKLSAEGWELAFVTSGVESDSGKGDGKGIYITRYIFKKVN